MSFNPLKRIVKSAFSQDPLQQIFWGHPTAETYQKFMLTFQSLSQRQKQQTITRIFKKLQKPKQTQLVINSLILLHKILKKRIIYLPSYEPMIQEDNKRKQFAGEKSFIKFYFNYLQLSQIQIMNKKSTFTQVLQYCQLSLKKCFQILKNHLVIEFNLNSSNNLNGLIKIAMKQIFQQIRNDLFQVTDIVQRNAKKIYQQKNQQSFALNQVYEKLIQLNKSLSKISYLIKKSSLNINLPIYQFDKDLNLKIQMQMNKRKQQKTKFKTEKHIKTLTSHKQIKQNSNKNSQIKTMKNLSYVQPNSNNYIQLSQIQQDQILIQYCQEIF